MSFLSSMTLSGGSMIDLDGTLFVQLAIFFIAFAILRAGVFKPLLKLFEARENATEGFREESEKLAVEVDEKSKKLDESLRQIRAQANAEKDAVRQEGSVEEQKILSAARQSSQQKVEKLEAQMDAQFQDVRQEMKAELPKLVSTIKFRLVEGRAA